MVPGGPSPSAGLCSRPRGSSRIETAHHLGLTLSLAWAEISSNFGSDSLQIESARLRLADAMLSVATEESNDVAALKAGALQAMARDDRSGIRPR
jgi:hypothetical protein